MKHDELLLGGDAQLRPGELVLAPELSELQLSPALIQRGISRGPIIAVALILLLIVAALATILTIRQQHRDASQEELLLELGAMPKVDPVILQQVAPEIAIAKNALVPITTAPVPAAKPFAFGEAGDDAQRATDCLAATVFYEAANEPVEGQLAVMQVVLNRVRHPAFPNSVCGVVFQGHERRTGCQFSYTCDGSLARRPSDASWAKYRAMARSMLTGAVYAPVGYATHYHADYVVPYWSSSLDKVHVMGRHIFYRWTGGWGTAKAFRAGHARLEALFPKLAMISPVHVTGNPALDNAALVMPTMPTEVVAPSAAVTGRMTTFIDEEKGTFLMRIEPGIDAAQLPLVAAQACGVREYCKILAWSRGTAMPKAFPVAEGDLGSMAFSFLRNREQGFEKPLWNCSIYPRTDRKQCIRKRVVIEGKEEELIPLSRPEPEAAAEERSDGLRSLSDREGERAAPKPLTAGERGLGRRRPGALE